MHHVVEDVFVSRDRVAVQVVPHGTLTGSFFCMPPTGRRVTKLFGAFDEAGLRRQLAALP